MACRADSESSSVSQTIQIAHGSNYLRERRWRRHSSASHPCLPSTRWSQRNQHSKSLATALSGPSMGTGIQGISVKYCGIQKEFPEFKLVLWPVLTSGQLQPALPNSSGGCFAVCCLYSMGIPALASDLQDNPRHGMWQVQVIAKLWDSSRKIGELPSLVPALHWCQWPVMRPDVASIMAKECQK